MKRKAYTITGQSFTKPVRLPDGFTVEETEMDDPRSIVIEGAWDLTVQPNIGGTVALVKLGKKGYTPRSAPLNPEQVRQLRDCLNAILGEQHETPTPADPNGWQLGDTVRWGQLHGSWFHAVLTQHLGGREWRGRTTRGNYCGAGTVVTVFSDHSEKVVLDDEGNEVSA